METILSINEADLLARIKAKKQINIKSLNYDELLICMELERSGLLTFKTTNRGNQSKRFIIIK
jgi:hypothetical protein